MKKRIIKVISYTILLFISIYLIVIFLENIGYKCIYRELFNIYCAGCGSTRMIKAIIHLNFYQAFRYNPLIFISLVLFIPYFIYRMYVYIRYGEFRILSVKILIVFAGFLIIYMILRNIPGFEYLIPTKI